MSGYTRSRTIYLRECDFIICISFRLFSPAKPWNRHSASGEHGKAFSHALACELMRGVVTQLDAEGTSHEYHRSGSCAALLWAGDFVVRLRFPLGKTLGILSSRSAWKSGSCIAAGVPRRTPRPPRQLSEEPPNAFFFLCRGIPRRDSCRRRHT